MPFRAPDNYREQDNANQGLHHEALVARSTAKTKATNEGNGNSAMIGTNDSLFITGHVHSGQLSTRSVQSVDDRC